MGVNETRSPVVFYVHQLDEQVINISNTEPAEERVCHKDVEYFWFGFNFGLVILVYIIMYTSALQRVVFKP